MTAKEYLSQAYRLDQRINSKIEQVASLNGLAVKCTSAITGMPHNPNRSDSMANAIAKIVDLQEQINRDIDSLVDLKAEIIGVIKAVDDTECQTLLEKRYLCFQPWEQIAVDMGYTIDNVFKVHKKALSGIRIPATLQ